MGGCKVPVRRLQVVTHVREGEKILGALEESDSIGMFGGGGGGWQRNRRLCFYLNVNSNRPRRRIIP